MSASGYPYNNLSTISGQVMGNIWGDKTNDKAFPLNKITMTANDSSFFFVKSSYIKVLGR